MAASDAAAPDNSNGAGGSESGLAITRAIGTAAAIIMAGNLTSSFLGFVRQAVIAKVFGANVGTDAFVAASIVPQMFYDLTIGAAVSAALIPTLTELVEKKDRDRLWRTVGSVLALVWIVLTSVIVVLIILARPLMTVILRGYPTHDPGALDLSIEIVRVLLPTLFFLGTSAVLLSALYSLRRFTAPAFATGLYHVGIIAGAIILARPLGILALPIGAVAGACAQVLAQLPSLFKARPRLSIRLELTPEIRRIIRLYAPVAAGLVVSIIGQVIDLGFKSQLVKGAITEMAFATTLTQFPIGIAVAAVSFAVLPVISADAAFDRTEQFKDTLSRGIRLVLFITIPAAVGYLALSVPIVSLLFEHGKFHQLDGTRTAQALSGYAIQIPFVGLDQLLIFSFYARRNTVTPMLVGVLGVGIYVVSALLLMPRLQILGLALSNTIQNSAHALILLGLLFASFGTLAGRGIPGAVARAVFAALIMGVAVATSARFLTGLVNVHTLGGQAVDVLLPAAIGAGLYLAVAAVLRSEELIAITNIALRRTA